MMKRITALVLSILLLVVAVLPQGVSATQTNQNPQVQQVIKEIRQHYYRTLAAAGKSSLHGWCGLLASYQLYFLGINKDPIMADGNDQYDIYKNLSQTETGFGVKAYSARYYTLEDALNAASRGGTRDVYNILVGFQSTSTAAGAIYGHAMVIYAIIDGIVYFTESFPCQIVAAEGMPSACTIEQFCDYYNRWTRFEGIIVFGNKDYADKCAEYNSHMYVQTQQSQLYSQPCTPEMEGADCKQVRSVLAGERLLVTGLYKNTANQYYYQVEDSGKICYLPAEHATPIRFQFEDITISDAVLPNQLQTGKKFTVSGEITSTRSWIDAVSATVYDTSGKIVMTTNLAKNSGIYNLKKELKLELHTLTEGAYTYELYADAACYYIQDGQLTTISEKVKICSVPFAVGGASADLPGGDNEAEPLKDGWHWEHGSWYYYEQGTPRSGWFCYDGVDYYLKKDGSVTTGWSQINGKFRFFSNTGAMRTGWLTDDTGTYYLLSNGEPAQGWRTVDDKLYYFTETGTLHKNGWITIGEDMFYMNADGSAATGWVTLKDGNYFFNEEDGHLMAQAVTKNGQTVFRAYDPSVGALTDLPTLHVGNAAKTINENIRPAC